MLEISASCIGCSKCVTACPFGAIAVENKLAKTNDKCTLCGACVQVCPVSAIEIKRKEESSDLSAYKGVWVFAELSDDRKTHGVKTVRGVTHELLSAGRRLADELGEELCAVLLGNGVEKLATDLASFGADKIYLAESEAFTDYSTDAAATAMVALITKHKPSIVL
jgi:electron transfer flavoprotein alpha subunit